MAFPSTDNFFDGLGLDLRKLLIQRPFLWKLNLSSNGPQTEHGQKPYEHLLWEVWIQVHVGWKLGDLALLELLDWVIGDLEFVPYSTLASSQSEDWVRSPVVSSAIARTSFSDALSL